MIMPEAVGGPDEQVGEDKLGWGELESDLFSSTREVCSGSIASVDFEFEDLRATSAETTPEETAPGPFDVVRQRQCPECGERTIPVLVEMRICGFCRRCYLAGVPYLHR